ncbi:lysophospholipid acyltransferase family protein [Chryseomicrobium sp. FSL W7-1435]|uniref:lysophospholipid acyltransferase family protein n=1 Tax=Chryseomicrobium sp. FSL W7-1435 TaxID=2921704 RepID=UPI00315A0C13
MNNLLRSLVTYSYIIGFIPTKLIRLKQLQKKKATLSTADYDELVYETPRSWAKNILKKAGATVELTGAENLPEGAVLLIANHEGNFDIPVLIATIQKPFGFLSKVEVKKIPFIADWMTEMNCVFIDRANRRSAMKSIEDSSISLQQGHSLLLFPEGTRSKGQGVQEFKAGFVRIASRANVPVVPIAIYGTSQLMEQQNNRVTPAHVKVHVLKPVQILEGESTDEFRERVQQSITNARLILEEASR